ncbi:MAG TPA: amidase [Mycobacteriales bacterium]|nr:amidase [Mycobacteriales bacterium]
MMDLDTITAAAAALRAGTTTSKALVEKVIRQADTWDGPLGVFLDRYQETALAAAERADADFAAGIDRGPLQGIPLGIKDIITTSEGPTTAQSLILDPIWGDRQDAPVVARLRAAGAIIVGKASTMEFAIGLPDPDKPFPVPRNPWNLDTWTGGSSSGTGSGVAAGLFLGGLGTDTGGSIRIPAAYCGITGLKPTFGRVPKSGCVPLGYSLDHIGPMARSAADCAAMLQVMAGQDASDPYTTDVPVPDYSAALTGSLDGLRVGFERGALAAAPVIDPAVPAALAAAESVFGDAGAAVRDSVLDCYDELTIVDWITMAAEAFAYHRGDLAERWNDYGRPTRRFVAQGALVSSADFVQAQRLRTDLVRQLGELFVDLDVLIMPTASTGAPRFDTLDMESMMGTIFTPAWNTVGLPVASVPMGFTADGMPLGMQIIGRPMAEATVLRVADAFQRQTDWHLRAPELPAGAVGTTLPAFNTDPVADADREAAAVTTALLLADGITVPADDLAALVKGHRELAQMSGCLRRARGELNPALGFNPGTPRTATSSSLIEVAPAA